MRILLLALFFLLTPQAQGFAWADGEVPKIKPKPTCTISSPLNNSTKLDPTCTYRQTISISQSDVVLDCQGASIDGQKKLKDGIVVGSVKEITDITVRNCNIRNFTGMGIYVKSSIPPQARLQLGEAAQNMFTPHDVKIEQNYITSNNIGIYIGDHVENSKILTNIIKENYGVGIYFEFGSSHGIAHNNTIVDNGWFGSRGASPHLYWPRIREGVAVDGSQYNLIYANKISGNAAGGIFLYRNCTESGAVNRNAPQRILGASFNTLQENRIDGPGVGIWIAQRQSQDLAFQKCGNPYYYAGKITLDLARNNVVERNTIRNEIHGIAVEDDDNTINFNDILSGQSCAVIGTEYRSEKLNLSVRNTVFDGNRCQTKNNVPEFIFSYGADRSRYGANFSLQNGSAIQPH